MATRWNTLGLVTLATVGMVVGAGCSAEVPTDDTNVSVGGEVITPRATGDLPECSGASAAKQLKATQLVQYIFGNDAYAPPTTTTACTNVKNALLDVRAALASGKATIGERWDYTVCSWYQSTVLTIETANQFSYKLPYATLAANVDVCYGASMSEFVLAPGSSDLMLMMDPEPATLTANLASTSGATAAAYFTNSPTTTTKVVYRSGAAAACGTLLGGEPCSTTALASGSEAKQMVLKTGSICTCR